MGDRHCHRSLLANVNRHTPDGTRIAVAGCVLDGEVRLTVGDTGAGISSEELEAIFGRFYRPQGTLSPGSGLGLAITRELVELHGGRIWAESTLGEGSVFHVVLPSQEGPTSAP